MKKVILFVLLFVPSFAFASTCTAGLMGLGMSAGLATQICTLLQPDTLEIPNGALSTLPSTCSVGQIYAVTDDDDCASTASGDGATCICKTANTWALLDNY